jgi:LysR family glycine cleavage system transcriptional activator
LQANQIFEKLGLEKLSLLMPVAPPRPKSLPLTALRAFEAAARLGSFASAAQELGVTAGAISAQVKSLEESIGSPLFHRRAKAVELTATGARVLPAFSQAFDQLGAAVQKLRDEATPQVVHIATSPAVAQYWLSPRLPRLRRDMPQASISITALETPPNLKRTPYDLCLFFDAEQGEVVDTDVIFPVCSPDLAARLTRPENLQDIPCLSDSTWESDWAHWLAAAGLKEQVIPSGPVYSLYALAVEEALNGAGVLMGHGALLKSFLRAGRLVAPFDTKVTLQKPLRLWYLPGRSPTAAVRQVADWLSSGENPPSVAG